MEYLIGIGVVYIVGNKVLNNNALVSKAISDRQNRSDTQFDEYTRDDYAEERMHFPDGVTDMELLDQGVVLADREYLLGPDPEREHPIFNVLNWYNGPNVPSMTEAEGYLI